MCTVLDVCVKKYCISYRYTEYAAYIHSHRETRKTCLLCVFEKRAILVEDVCWFEESFSMASILHVCFFWAPCLSDDLSTGRRASMKSADIDKLFWNLRGWPTNHRCARVLLSPRNPSNLKTNRLNRSTFYRSLDKTSAFPWLWLQMVLKISRHYQDQMLKDGWFGWSSWSPTQNVEHTIWRDMRTSHKSHGLHAFVGPARGQRLEMVIPCDYEDFQYMMCLIIQ